MSYSPGLHTTRLSQGWNGHCEPFFALAVLSRKQSMRLIEIGGAITQADILIVQGRLHEALTTYERALQWAMAPGAPVLRGAADMYGGMSDLHCEHNDLQTATQHLLTSQALGELAGLPQNPYRWCAAMARIQETQGDLYEALDLNVSDFTEIHTQPINVRCWPSFSGLTL